MAASLAHYFSVGNVQWTIRRRLVIYTLLFCGAMIIWAAQWMRIETAQTVITNCFNVMMVLVTGYILGNVTDDHLKRKADAGAYSAPAEQNVNVASADTTIKPQ